MGTRPPYTQEMLKLMDDGTLKKIANQYTHQLPGSGSFMIHVEGRLVIADTEEDLFVQFLDAIRNQPRVKRKTEGMG